jgi:PST family polysaccharide transporter
MHKAVIKDILWLCAQQILSSGMPLLSMLVIANRLGSDGWGVVSFLTSFAYIATLFVENGFYISGQKEVIKANGNISELQKILSNVVSARILICILVFVIFLCIELALNNFVDHRIAAAIALAYGVMNGFSFFWVLRGLGKLKQSVLIEVLWKVFSLPPVFIFVENLNDITTYFTILLITQISIIVTYLIYIRDIASKIKFSYVNIKNGIKMGANISIPHIIGSIFSVINPLTLGFLSTYQQVGIYSASEKIVRLIGQIFDPIKIALFIRVNKVEYNSHYIYKIYSTILIVFAALLSMIIYFFSKEIIMIIYGNGFTDSIKILEILSIFPTILSINIVFGFLWLIPNGYEYLLTPILLISTFVNITIAFFAIPTFGATGMAYAFLISEFILAFLFFLSFIKKYSIKK